MLSAPWIKRIELQTGEKRAMQLPADALFPTANVKDEAGDFSEHAMCDGVSWYHVTRRGKQWLLHGSVMTSGSALYVFMEYPEARHPELEAAISREAHAADVYADWLEEQGDPFAGALKPELAKERGPAGLWWLEGFERTGVVTTTVRDGFVREAAVGPIDSTQLNSTLHRLCHVRACLALEQLVIDPRALGSNDWSAISAWSMWTDVQWPSSLKNISFARNAKRKPGSKSLKVIQDKLARRYPSLVVEA